MRRVRTSIAVLFSVVTLGGGAVVAQVQGMNQETLQVPLGSIFEMQAVAEPDASANWVLTKQGEFVEAGRDRVFRTRFSQEGNYALAAQVTENGLTVERLFLLEIRQRRPEDLETQTTPDVVAISPVPSNGVIPVSSDKQVVLISPIRDDIAILAVDFDTTKDTNGDGNTQNDEDTRATLFRSEGNPLYAWFVGGRSRSIRLGALATDGKTTFSVLSVGNGAPGPSGNGETPAGTPIEQETDMQILVLRSDNGEVQFSLRVPAEVRSPLLLLWDFGDGSQSMLDKPIHTYPESGKYSVSVEVRDLQSGKVIATAKDAIMINRLLEVTEVPEDPEEKSKGDGRSLLGTVFMLLLSLIASALIGTVAVVLVGKLRRREFSLEKTLEKAEKTMVKSPQETVAQAAPPMEISAEEIRDAEVAADAKEPESATEAEFSAEEPVSQTQQTAATPSWLSQGLERATEPALPIPEPPVPEVPVAEPSPPPPPVEPVPVPTPPAPEAAPAPAPEAAPHVAHSPMQPSPTALITDTSNAPDWLQAGMQKAAQQKQAPDTPPPSTLQSAPPTIAPSEIPPVENTLNTVAEKEESASLDEPVAFVKAEDIPPLENADGRNPPPPPQSDSDREHTEARQPEADVPEEGKKAT